MRGTDVTTISESTVVVTTENCLSTTIDGETVILHRDKGKYYGLNDVGTFVWELVQQPHTVENICQEIIAEYDVEYERCRNDVEEVLLEMADKNLVRFETE